MNMKLSMQASKPSRTLLMNTFQNASQKRQRFTKVLREPDPPLHHLKFYRLYLSLQATGYTLTFPYPTSSLSQALRMYNVLESPLVYIPHLHTKPQTRNGIEGSGAASTDHHSIIPSASTSSTICYEIPSPEIE
ncbi:hypothetical protein QAD02_012170 [Eretmocerus hayati]|uniref:Uncharacterized protein n=1 Tax=Eretmocerus hayati TaxID=131215 RepID=A0ACC2NZT4_9HYME|nr:hypothetical protein QAD02_012170 [Eretmocerus hayati]